MKEKDLKTIRKLNIYMEENKNEIMTDYLLMTWFIGQDKKMEKAYEKLRKEVMEESKELGLPNGKLE